MSQDVIGSSLRQIRNQVPTKDNSISGSFNAPDKRYDNQNQKPSVRERLGPINNRGRGLFRGRGNVRGQSIKFHLNLSQKPPQEHHHQYNGVPGEAYPIPA